MSTPVVTDTWAGQFDCNVCRRKRLMAAEFSNKALERYRKNGGPLKCKQCVAQAEAKEREQAAAKRLLAAASEAAATSVTTTTGVEPLSVDASSASNLSKTGVDQETLTNRTCAACQKQLDMAAYNRNQWNKGQGKSKCRDCVEQLIQDEQRQQTDQKAAAIAVAQAKVDQLQKASGSSAKAMLQAESELAALQAEQVTGLKPIKMSSMSSSLRFRGSSGGRSSSGGGRRGGGGGGGPRGGGRVQGGGR